MVGTKMLSIIFVSLILLRICSGIFVYEPQKERIMLNSSSFWARKAKHRGINICAEETVDGIEYDQVWTSGSLCVPTSVKFVCCEGYVKPNSHERSCTLMTDLETVSKISERLRISLFVQLIEKAGLYRYLDFTSRSISIFAPLDVSIHRLYFSTKSKLEFLSGRATRLIDGPSFLTSHIFHGRLNLNVLPDNTLIKPLSNRYPVRFNSFPNGLKTLDCVPVVRRNIATTDPLLYTLASTLNDEMHFLPLMDTLFRSHQTKEFASYIIQSGLRDELRSKSPITAFVPSDEAFKSLTSGHKMLLRRDTEAMKALVKNHLVNGIQCGVMLSKGRFKTLQNKQITSKCRSREVLISGAQVLRQDKMSSNGVIHLINKILLPERAMLLPDLLESLQADSFVRELRRYRLIDYINSDKPKTIFAPINFDISHLGSTDVKQLLLNHLAHGTILISDLKNQQTIPTEGFPLNVKLHQKKIVIGNSLLLKRDVVGLNGVVHIMKNIFTIPRQQTILQYLQGSGRFHYFLRYLETIDRRLYSKLGNPGQKLTVFPIPDWYMSANYYNNHYHYLYNPTLFSSHIVDREILSAELPLNGSYIVKTFGDQLVLFQMKGFYAGRGKVMEKDIVCINGVIHVVSNLVL